MSARKDSRPYGGAVPAGTEWLLVQTQRHKERAVQAALASEGIPTHLSLLRQWPRPAVGGDVGPMFPGLYSASPNPIRLSGVASCNGALRLVSFGDAPARTPTLAGTPAAPRFVFALPCDVPLRSSIAHFI